MSNENWMKKLERWEPESENDRFNRKRDKEKCKDFQKDNDGYCKNYIGCTSLINTSCIKKCKLR